MPSQDEYFTGRFLECPNYGNEEDGDYIAKCDDCGKIYCEKCEGCGWIPLTTVSPNCNGRGTIIGKINSDSDS